MSDGLGLANVTHCACTANHNSSRCSYRDCRCLHAGNDRESVGLAFKSTGTSRETPYTFLNFARCHCKRWKELLLLQWSTKRSNPAAVSGRPTEDHLHQRSADQGEGELRDHAVYGHDEFALSWPSSISGRSTGRRLGHDGHARTNTPL